jgi:hypothetical protein
VARLELEGLVSPPPLNYRDPSAEPLLRERRARVCATLRVLLPRVGARRHPRLPRRSPVRLLAVRPSGGHLSIADHDRCRGANIDAIFDYDEALRLYEDAFGPENVIVLPFELLRDDAPAFLAALSAGWPAGVAGPPAPERLAHPAELDWYPASRAASGGCALSSSRRGRAALHQARIGGRT